MCGARTLIFVLPSKQVLPMWAEIHMGTALPDVTVGRMAERWNWTSSFGCLWKKPGMIQTPSAATPFRRIEAPSMSPGEKPLGGVTKANTHGQCPFMFMTDGNSL